MRITYKGDYALKTILILVASYGKKPVTISELACQADIPVKFLEQILLDLKRGGFVQSQRGKIGGYSLAKHPSKITLGDVVRFIDGPVEPIACVSSSYSGCNDIRKCVFRPVWQAISRKIAQVVDNVNFEQLAKDYYKKKGNINLTYQI
ncbi:MAG: Rrf2 family transcriptional regulator [Candidatus Omnitrophica bacterium]|jgi:Rrf2 family protein|nr:Rrf2 family transcriptional regulator [Candidatus Omnitrophota bacterium]